MVDILDSSTQHVHCKISHGAVSMLVTICYGSNFATQRQGLWDFLQTCAGLVSLPWMDLGEFNII